MRLTCVTGWTARLESGLEHVYGVLGEGVDERVAADTLVHFDFDAEKALNWLLEHNRMFSLVGQV